jgi:hypothetical protein
MIEKLMAALKEEFDQEVVFYPAPPSTVTAPSVAVVPGDPFLEPNTQGMVLERWDVWAVASLKSPDKGAADMRNLSLRVAAVAQKVGATWRNSSGPRRTAADPQAQEVVSVSRLDFKYPPSSVTGE